MKKKPIYTINGKNCKTLQGFFDEITALFQLGRWGYNLDAFNDILRGGFGTPEGGFVIYWEHSKYSGHHLGARTFDSLVEIIRIHGEGGEEAQDGVELELF